MEPNKKLYRSSKDRVIAGVCGGLGEYFEIDSLVFRILMLLLLFMGGSGFLIYLILVLLMPKQGSESSGDVFTDVGERVQEIAKEMKEKHSVHPENRRTTFGLIIILLGVVLLLNQIFPMFIRWDIVFPLAVIAVGIILISRYRHD